MSDSSLTIVGNLTRDPEIRALVGGTRCSLGVAVNRRWQNRETKEWTEQVSFIPVVCWRELAEHAGDCLRKGMRVVVTGRLEQRSFDVEGVRRSVFELVADDLGPSLRFATATVEKVPRGVRGNSPSSGTVEDADEGEIF